MSEVRDTFSVSLSVIQFDPSPSPCRHRLARLALNRRCSAAYSASRRASPRSLRPEASAALRYCVTSPQKVSHRSPQSLRCASQPWASVCERGTQHCHAPRRKANRVEEEAPRGRHGRGASGNGRGTLPHRRSRCVRVIAPCDAAVGALRVLAASRTPARMLQHVDANKLIRIQAQLVIARVDHRQGRSRRSRATASSRVLRW